MNDLLHCTCIFLLHCIRTYIYNFDFKSAFKYKRHMKDIHGETSGEKSARSKLAVWMICFIALVFFCFIALLFTFASLHSCMYEWFASLHSYSLCFIALVFFLLHCTRIFFASLHSYFFCFIALVCIFASLPLYIFYYYYLLYSSSLNIWQNKYSSHNLFGLLDCYQSKLPRFILGLEWSLVLFHMLFHHDWPCTVLWRKKLPWSILNQAFYYWVKTWDFSNMLFFVDRPCTFLSKQTSMVHTQSSIWYWVLY